MSDRVASVAWRPWRWPAGSTRLRAILADAGADGRPVDALLVTTPANIRWLTGFSGSAGLLAGHRRTAPLLTTDGRYRTQASEQLDAAGATATGSSGGRGRAGPARGAGAAGAGRVDDLGLEADHVTWAAQRRWAEDLAPAVAGADERAGRAAADRSRTPGEVVRMARAAAIADAALGRGAAPAGRGGRPEGRDADAHRVALRRRPGPRHAASAGPRTAPSRPSWRRAQNSAKPHARPGDAGHRARATRWWWTSAPSSTATAPT